MVDTPVVWKDWTQANTSDAPQPGGLFLQGDGQVVALQDGGYIVFWVDESRTHNSLGSVTVAQKYDYLGEKVGGEIVVWFSFEVNEHSPSFVLLPDGRIAGVAVCVDGVGNQELQGVIFDQNLVGVQSTQLIASGTGQNFNPVVTPLFNDGSFIVAYTVGSGSDTDIVYRVVSPNGNVGSVIDIHNQTDNSQAVQMATLSNGGFVAVYEDEDNGSSTDIDVRYRVYTVLGTEIATDIVAAGTEAETGPDVAALVGGGFVIVYTGDDLFGSDGIRAQIRDNTGGMIAADFLVNSTTNGNQNEASVVALLDGGFVVTWEDDQAGVVRAQRFDAVGNPVGTEFVVNTTLPPDGRPEAALLEDGRFAYAFGHITPGTSNVDTITSIWDPRTSPINGTPGDDTMVGFQFVAAIEINGLGGNDFIDGYNQIGAVINGGSGNDELRGTAGVDTLNGGDDNDLIYGAAGNDILLGGPDIDQLFGGADNDRLFGDAGADFLNGGTGNDRLTGGADNDTLTGGPGSGTPAPIGFNPVALWGSGATASDKTADFNNDGKDDIIQFRANGTAFVWLSNGTSFNSPTQWGSGFIPADRVGDFNNDGRSDAIQLHDNGNAYVWFSNGTSFNNYIWAGSGHVAADKIGDFNGDGRDDIIQLHSNGNAYVWLANGAGFNSYGWWGSGFTPSDVIGEFNGDGKKDIIQLHDNGNAYVWFSNGASFNNYIYAGSGHTAADKIGDFNGDGKQDIIQLHSNGNAYVWLANGAGFNSYGWWGGGHTPNDKIADFNGDGKDDLIQLNTNGDALVWLSNGTSFDAFTVWGDGVLPSDKLADVTGDGRTDVIQFNGDGNLYVWTAQNNGPNDTFAFAANFGNDIITDFQAGAGPGDVIEFEQDVFADFSDVLAHTADDGTGNTIITHDNGDTILLMNVLKSNLAANDFQFV